MTQYFATCWELPINIKYHSSLQKAYTPAGKKQQEWMNSRLTQNSLQLNCWYKLLNAYLFQKKSWISKSLVFPGILLLKKVRFHPGPSLESAIKVVREYKPYREYSWSKIETKLEKCNIDCTQMEGKGSLVRNSWELTIWSDYTR